MVRPGERAILGVHKPTPKRNDDPPVHPGRAGWSDGPRRASRGRATIPAFFPGPGTTLAAGTTHNTFPRISSGASVARRRRSKKSLGRYPGPENIAKDASRIAAKAPGNDRRLAGGKNGSPSARHRQDSDEWVLS